MCKHHPILSHCFECVVESDAKWDIYFLEDAQFRARKSKDRSTKVGAVIVNDRKIPLISGWNGFPRGIDDEVDARHERPAKYLWTEHAERNAIYNAAAEGISLRDTTIYIWPLMPCVDCTRAIIQCGIKRVVCPEPDWADEIKINTFHFDVSRDMLLEANIDLDFQNVPSP